MSNFDEDGLLKGGREIGQGPCKEILLETRGKVTFRKSGTGTRHTNNNHIC
jgi:hypothetical protein